MTKAATLLELLAKHTTIDLDQNDAAVAKLFGPFTDMTSNQAILYGELQKKNHSQFVSEAVVEAQMLVEASAPGAKGRDIAAVAVDVMGIKLALTVVPFVTGFVHSQTNPSMARSVAKTIVHGKNLVALYKHYGIPSDRLCLKIPGTVAGLRACGELEKEGITTLATIICCEGQAIVAGELGATYVAPYINPLSVHFGGTHVYPAPHGIPGFKTAAVVQATFKDRGIKTQVMAASLVSLEEALCLAGLSHSTLSGPILALLATTPPTPAYEELIAQSVAYYDSAIPSTNVYTIDGTSEDQLLPDGCGEEAESLTISALQIFTGFEGNLFVLAKEALGKLGAGEN